MSDAKLQRQRQRWFRNNPQCYWCGRRLIYVLQQRNVTCPAHAATIDHLRPRGDPSRTVPARGDKRRVLSCHACNLRRDQEEMRRRSLEWLWKQSGVWDRKIRELGCLDSQVSE